MTATVQAAWWRPARNGAVVCELCPLGCRVRAGRDGPCGTRGNRGGEMRPLQYAQVVSAGLDPIEKKPLYHFHPGRQIFSIAAAGCNLHCAFCQNWTISQQRGGATRRLEPAAAVAMAAGLDSVGIAYTYSEPLVWYEYVRDTARLAREAGLRNVVVTNGFLNPGPLAQLSPLLDAANVDLKSMEDAFYRKICKARLQPVLDAIEHLHAAGVHLEITNLVIPGHNDADVQIEALVDFVAGVDRAIPLHFSAYRPAWKLRAPPTPVATLQRAAAIARARLDFVYLGNVILAGASDTVCPGCGETVVRRGGYAVEALLDGEGACPSCGRRIIRREP
ncbi:AmmeMemoRadiSam system radical SAM enzyme [bacterium]|nr:AmmeMemoRadiSam system radical SAM enzyme [bacterium]MBU1073228.1 AmmeMemoRadiSam system radical SAM enzyme [bacterium]MBU1676821.1 AmmeMemoRadiSam system radical SAM enzyme [bacterium]